MARKIYVYHTGMVAMHGGGRKAVLDSYMYLFQYRYDTLKGSRQRCIIAEKHCKVSIITFFCDAQKMAVDEVSLMSSN